MRVDPILEASEQMAKKQTVNSFINGAVFCLVLISLIYMTSHEKSRKLLKKA
jgi:hypothetical protein|tara:strand:- start:56 stop:211 length:156 start_codon:yes stop_codon:yes gene_type:complete